MNEIKTAVIGVDPQIDFCPGGTLPVKDGDKVMEPLNQMFEYAARNGWKTALSRDWHPLTTVHFDNWPIHCVENTPGAMFHPDLKTDGINVFSKGMANSDDGYSPFEGRDSNNSTLDEFLEGVKRLYIGGLATDYCVRAAVLDAIKREYEVYLILDAVRAVDVNPGDGDRAIAEMIGKGAKVTTAHEVVLFGEGA